MGKILSRFRKEKSTYQVLESLEEKIKTIEAYTLSTQEKQKRLIGNFLVISIGLYVISFIVFYFVFFPPTWEKRIVYSTPLLIFPILIFLIKRLVAWYFQRKVNKNSSQLQDLRSQKKELLEQVMDKETYKVALEILNRFSDKPSMVRPITQSPQASTPRTSQSQTQRTPIQNQQQTLVRRNVPQPPQPQSLTPRPIMSSQTPLSSSYGFRSPLPQQPLNRQIISPVPALAHQLRTPYPIINQSNKGVLEKFVDYMVGDGPSSRFAMICKQCYSHNGMCPQEEFEYAAFKCAFCGFLNPARKQRIAAPRLGTPDRRLTAERRLSNSSSSSSTSEEEKKSDSDSDSDHKIEYVALVGQEQEPKEDVPVVDVTPESNDQKDNDTPVVEEQSEEKPDTDKKDD